MLMDQNTARFAQSWQEKAKALDVGLLQCCFDAVSAVNYRARRCVPPLSSWRSPTPYRMWASRFTHCRRCLQSLVHLRMGEISMVPGGCGRVHSSGWLDGGSCEKRGWAVKIRILNLWVRDFLILLVVIPFFGQGSETELGDLGQPTEGSPGQALLVGRCHGWCHDAMVAVRTKLKVPSTPSPQSVSLLTKFSTWLPCLSLPRMPQQKFL